MYFNWICIFLTTHEEFHALNLRPIPTRPIWSPPTAIVGRLESADWVGVKILNMFDMESRPTIVKSANSGIESALQSVLQSADLNTDSSTDHY